MGHPHLSCGRGALWCDMSGVRYCRDDSDALLEAVEAVVHAERAEGRVIWGSMHQRMADRLRQRNPRSHHFFSPRDILRLYVLYLTGLLPSSPCRLSTSSCPSSMQPCAPLLVSRISAQVGPYLAERVGGGLLQWLARRPSLFFHLRQRGCPVILWVVNDETDMKEALDTEQRVS